MKLENIIKDIKSENDYKLLNNFLSHKWKTSHHIKWGYRIMCENCGINAYSYYSKRNEYTCSENLVKNIIE